MDDVAHGSSTFLLSSLCDWLAMHPPMFTRCTGFYLCGCVQFDSSHNTIFNKTFSSVRCNMTHSTMELINCDGLNCSCGGNSSWHSWTMLHAISPILLVHNA